MTGISGVARPRKYSRLGRGNTPSSPNLNKLAAGSHGVDP